MAILGKDSLLFGASGRIGDMIYCSNGERTIIRNAPVKKSGYRESEHMKVQRLKFSFASQFIANAAAVFRLGFSFITGWNSRAMAALMNNALQLKDGNIVVDFSRLVLSAGTLNVRTKPALEIGKAGAHLRWNCRPADKNKNKHELVAVLYRHDSNRWEIFSAPKSDKLLQISLPLPSDGAACEGYFFFRDTLSGEVSKSTYLGQISVKEGEDQFSVHIDKA